MTDAPDLRTAALAYADAPGPATETGLELAAVRSTIDRVRETGEAFPPAAMVLLEQLAEDPCRCGTDRAMCGCDRVFLGSSDYVRRMLEMRGVTLKPR